MMIYHSHQCILSVSQWSRTHGHHRHSHLVMTICQLPQRLLHAVNCGRFCFWLRQSVVFVYVRNISGTAERIYAKITLKTCMVSRSEEFEGQGHQGQRMAFFSLLVACVQFVFGKTSVGCSERRPQSLLFYSPFLQENVHYPIVCVFFSCTCSKGEYLKIGDNRFCTSRMSPNQQSEH